ncbi:MAG TPA: carboxypeptidase-like regulatory domain-containing protein [Parafilimonas sp.]
MEVKGVVYEDSTRKPVEGASVFLSNTSFGTVTDGRGNFKLSVTRQGTYALIVTSVVYTTYSKMILINNNTGYITILLKPKINQLKDVVVSDKRKKEIEDGWLKYGNFFLDNFIGTSKEARQCILKNRSAISFIFSQKKNELTAFANQPLIIENKSLGYTIKYQLENFVYNYDSKYLSFNGYALFSEMDGNVRKQFSWQQQRKEMYNLSIIRFIRALYANKLAENDYMVHRLHTNVANPEKEKMRIQKLAYDSTHSRNINKHPYERSLSSTELVYYKKIMSQPDTIDVISNDLLTADSIVSTENDSVKALTFSDHIIINYTTQKPPLKYKWANPDAKDSVSSVLSLVNNKSVIISADGSYYNVQDLLYEGFWGWWQRLATMLPYDYEPSEK